MDTEQLLKQYRKKPVALPEDLPVRTAVGREGIRRIIPHRDPMLFVDKITGLDLENGIITGERYLSPDDPVFAGHFPDFPVYPGSLEVEMTGQLGLCLFYFVQNGRTDIGDDAEPVDIRATRVLGAHYLAPLLPGTTAVIVAKQIDYDGFFAKAIGQVIADGTVCCTAIGEVVFP